MIHILIVAIMAMVSVSPVTVYAKEQPALNAIAFMDAGATPKSLKDWQGKVVLVNLWATWCAPCLEELPALATLHHIYAAKGFEVVAISQDAAGLKIVKPLFAKRQIDLPIYTDSGGNFFSALKIEGLPMSYLLDAKGRVVKTYQGNQDWLSKDIAGDITPLLSSPASAPQK